MYNHDVNAYDAIIILGHSAGKSGISGRQKKRLDFALKNITNEILIVTGGFGWFNKTNRALSDQCKDYLVSGGVPIEQVVNIPNSTNTLEDAKYSLEYIVHSNFTRVLVVTSADHMIRTKLIFKRLTPKNIKLDFAISDYWGGMVTFWDLAWHIAGLIKYFLFGRYKF